MTEQQWVTLLVKLIRVFEGSWKCGQEILLTWKRIYRHFGVLRFHPILKTDFDCFISIKVQRCLCLCITCLYGFCLCSDWKILVTGLTNTFMEVQCWNPFIISPMLMVMEKAWMIFTTWPNTLQLCQQTLVRDTKLLDLIMNETKQ